MHRARWFAACTAAATLLMCAPATAASPAKTTPIVVKVARGGFSLIDAAVGAVAGAGAVIATAGLVVLLRLRREDANTRTKGERQ